MQVNLVFKGITVSPPPISPHFLLLVKLAIGYKTGKDPATLPCKWTAKKLDSQLVHWVVEVELFNTGRHNSRATTQGGGWGAGNKVEGAHMPVSPPLRDRKSRSPRPPLSPPDPRERHSRAKWPGLPHL